MHKERLLLVEDEPIQRDALVEYLRRNGYTLDAVGSGEEAMSMLEVNDYSVLVTDLRLPGIDGLEVIRRARKRDSALGLLLVTAFASIDSAVNALRIGAHDYLLKPLMLEDVQRKIENLLSHRRLLIENARLRRAVQQQRDSTELVTTSPAMKEVLQWVERAARTNATVLVTGETGTGKEVVARAVHRLSPASEEPFLAINLAAVPENMVASELFGHEKGAFTGAERRREGLLRAAGKGMVFLDEVGELPIAVQAQLLRALEAKEVQPLGSDRAVPFQARVVAATHRDLQKSMADGTFREDLFFRLNVILIHLPPLNDRPEDIPELIQELVERHAKRKGVPVPVVSAAAVRALCRHPWRGNVRELSNVLERALILADDGMVDLDRLPTDITDSEELGWELKGAVERFERAHIATLLRLCRGNREKAAEELGLSLATLYRRLERYGLKGYEVHRGSPPKEIEP
ncbi:MAG: hypothetical protein AUK47_11810 [Deltaproteobacteria bacterium CG2_30_63_29]|nr:MAG: hypothetical protein AUK47_11810 [Deltaproteobacteria bacterium CG2_30_63_29]PJB43430.1 MAG: Fis family transcriptional regulator [Deltaproteobacteria bacterium CG_4_9_14_3_um_filter_63_12]